MFTMLTIVSILVSVALVVAGTTSYEEKSLADVTVKHVNASDNNELQLDIQAFGNVYHFDLIPAPKIFHPALREYFANTDENGTNSIVMAHDMLSDHKRMMDQLYTDKTGHASLHVEERHGHVYVEGKLNENMRILPTGGGRIAQAPTHVVFRKVESDYLPHGTCKSAVPNMTLPVEPTYEERALPSLVQPEVLLVLDYEMSKYFQFDQGLVKKYLAIFFNSVNSRYATMDYPKIRNVITDIILTKSETSQPYVVKLPGNIVDADKTLEQFGKWMFQQKNVIKSTHDFAYWISGLDLASSNGVTFDKSTQGIAYIGAACMVSYDRNYKVGIGEDIPGTYSGVHTAAHETAHLLGSAHDGQVVNNPPGNPGGTSCPWTDGFIMSYEFGTKNKFFYSSCSQKEIAFTLQSRQAACLLNNPTENVVPTTNQKYPGEIISLNDQCKTQHGANSYFYTPYESQVCVKRWCVLSSNDLWKISLTSNGPAYEGSECDIGKWCIKGQCVSK